MHVYAYANAMQLRTKHLRCYRAHPLCDFFGVEDLTWEATEELEDDMMM
jgi:hypothetical protein